MKFRNFFEILGFRGKAKHYGYEEHECALSQGQSVTYARWSHPYEASKTIDPAFVDAYREILSEGDFCIDIGAHTGDSTLPIGLAVGVSGLVLALEPNPYVYHVLERNVRANRDRMTIDTILAAASDHQGFLEFEYSDSGYCNGGRHENIPLLAHGHAFKLEVFCLDLAKELRSTYGEFLPRLKFIKTDTEGYDLYVVKGLLPIIREFRPTLKVEVFKKTSVEYRRELLNLFTGIDYDVFVIDREPIHPGVRLTESNLTERSHYDILCSPRA